MSRKRGFHLRQKLEDWLSILLTILLIIEAVADIVSKYLS